MVSRSPKIQVWPDNRNDILICFACNTRSVQHISSCEISSTFVWATVRTFPQSISCFCRGHQRNGLPDMKSDRMLNTSHELLCLSLISSHHYTLVHFVVKVKELAVAPVKLYGSKQQSFPRPFRHKEQNVRRIWTALSIKQAPSKFCFVILHPHFFQ